ncbi:cell division protein ZapE [Luteimonas sp. SX5]|uniref:Cell division protein ZapE n=1 Tax=Luteimonas galliterrae TaxID=2940486 RepID=A0ABT0MMH4_9GAMM|nr:cell division protein ZapE [Luteimonas galliterrae]MCL1636087.1 cell division protein ZapE [Luteimonas galliterrae]
MADAKAAALPSENYRAGAARGDWQDDPAQRGALRELDRIHAALVAPPKSRGLLERMFGEGPPPPERGLYLWGGVGRGKTFLIDLFYDGLPIAQKRRTHFHRFMRDVHERLRAHAGERDPLAIIAKEWQRTLRVLVLDEFFVSDIGDAMLLGRLLDRLFAEGVILVTTSNSAPGELYKDGLQRARFLPAIALIQQHCIIAHLDSPTDYRLRELTRSPVYRAPLDAGSDAWLESRWHALGGDDAHRGGTIELEGRKIAVRARCKGMAWFDFAELCEGPRGASDYIEIAREFHTVLLGGIPRLEERMDNPARRFITLIDELYDRHVNLVCTADAPPPALYEGTRLAAAFERTASRLIEMQSAEYLTLEHRQ